MAYLKIFPIKVTDKKALDYITNPDKTDEKLLVSSFGCSPETADLEFSMTREMEKRMEWTKAIIICAFSALSVHIHLIVIIPDNPTAKIQPQSLFQQRSCTFRWYHYCFALPVGVFACTSRIISGKHVPQDVSAPSIVKVQSEELSEPLLRL